MIREFVFSVDTIFHGSMNEYGNIWCEEKSDPLPFPPSVQGRRVGRLGLGTTTPPGLLLSSFTLRRSTPSHTSRATVSNLNLSCLSYCYLLVDTKVVFWVLDSRILMIPESLSDNQEQRMFQQIPFYCPCICFIFCRRKGNFLYDCQSHMSCVFVLC